MPDELEGKDLNTFICAKCKEERSIYDSTQFTYSVGFSQEKHCTLLCKDCVKKILDQNNIKPSIEIKEVRL